MDWLLTLTILAALALGAAAGTWLATQRLKRAYARARRLEQRARESERLAYAGRLTSGLMHEIKNPLSTLNLNLQLLAEDLHAPHTDTERRMARKIQVLQEETKRLEDILNKFMAFVGRMELKRSPLDLGQLVADLVAFYEPQADQQRITLRSAVEENLPTIQADADLLKQALLNLILNAQAAMSEGGELMIGVRADGADVVATVTDTGCGIPPERLPRVFDAYFSTRPGGSGLGLSIVKRIVTEHGGKVSVASEVGRGTQFTLRLPTAAEDTGAASE